MQSKKRIIVFFVSCMILTVLIFVMLSPDESMSVASTPGVVDVSTSLNVRTGPGIDYDILSSSGMDISLQNGTQVSVLSSEGDWYHISFKYGTETLKGYVLARYIKVNKTALTQEVQAKVTANSLNVRTRAGMDKKVSQINGTDVRLSKGKKVIILKEKMVDKEKWYYISFTYNKKSCKGYVLSTYVKLVLNESVAAAIRSTSGVKVKEAPGAGSKVLMRQGKAVVLSDTKNVSIIKETTKSAKKWFRVKFTYGKDTLKGYVPANKVRYGIVKETSQASSQGKATATPKTSKTAKPDATTQPEQTKKPAQSEQPQATATPKPLTMKQFKKHLKDEKFPESYQEALIALHKKYPLWQFEADHTGLDWGTAVSKESVVGLNLITNGKSSGWKSFATGAYDYLTDAFIPYDGSTWVTASEAAVKYYMDPRNFLDERGIFQFENLMYRNNYQTQSGVEQILYNTPMYQTKYSYQNDKGETKYMLYSKTFVKAAEKSGVSPYHLASRAKQEVVTSSTTMSTSVSGTVSGFAGIYNFYNIGATHSTVAGGAIRNGLSFAASDTTYLRPWNNRRKAIIGGAIYIGENYINRGQNTLYLQKFNVTKTNTYSHQYMANIEAPNAEATKTNTAYGSSKESMPILFSIPVYENMPGTACDVPGSVANPNNYLKSLIVSNGVLEPTFELGDDGSKTYKVTVENHISNLSISAVPVSANAKVTGDGNKNIEVGTKTYTIKVTAENGNVRSYKLEITRKKTAGTDKDEASSKKSNLPGNEEALPQDDAKEDEAVGSKGDALTE